MNDISDEHEVRVKHVAYDVRFEILLLVLKWLKSQEGGVELAS